ncbi:hypothetical protein HQ312_12460 [Rhodococcus sp. BP-316]|uniref:reprolysin-like metallopeptidase n=1 Tax=Rhodococcus sp. BP-316 TaxID=2739445 RepID=UPI001C9AC5DB|nr:M43 family zinc metalloprotease [Rhodococcus sp. BP-316]MBY6681866.1 hypothetical protein [Rhodococcus sp. BP-316]
MTKRRNSDSKIVNSRPKHSRKKVALPLTLLTLVTILLLSTPGIANADQFRNGRWVYGSIEREFVDFLSGANQFGQGGTSSIGEPTSDELLAFNGGRWQEFGFTNRILWSPNVDPNKGRQIGGLILQKWLDLNYEVGVHKYPITRELQANGGRFNDFESGSIYYKYGAIQARSVRGAIYTQWGQANWENGQYGWPISDGVACTTASNRNAAPAKGQLFERGALYDGTDANFHNGYSSVVDRFVQVANKSTKYANQVAAGTSRWNGQGRVQFIAAPNTPDLEIIDVNIPNNGNQGLYSWFPNGVDQIYYNDAYMSKLGAQKNQAIVTHELGHAFGLSHSCSGQLMGIGSGPTGDLGQIDIESLRRLWG